MRRLRARLSGTIAAGLALAFATALVAVALRLDLAFELPLDGSSRLSERTREAVSQVTTPVHITCFMGANHPARRPAMRLLRGLRAAAAGGSGAPLSITFVDPRRDLAAARRLIDAGVAPDTLVFDSGTRRLTVSAADLLTLSAGPADRNRALFAGESLCVAALERLGRGAPEVIYWLTGHGEASAQDYDPQTGYSDLAREIAHNGFMVHSLRLWETKAVPPDAAALLVIAPRHTLAPEEAGWVQDYLNKGGRLLYLAPTHGRSGLEEVLSRWGIVLTTYRAVSARTLSGMDRVIASYGEHPITRGFNDTATVFLSPWCIETVSFGDAEAADRIRVTTLAQTSAEGWGEADETHPPRFDAETDIPGPVTIAAAAERGGGASADLGFRATRVVAVGEGAFVSNGLLGKRLSANRDLVMNMVNWLTGIDAASLPSLGGDAALASGLDRAGWLRLLVWVAVFVPAAVLLIGFLVGWRGRRVG